MDIKLELATDLKVIETLFQYYIYDMSEYTGFSPDEKGSYAVSDDVSKLSEYWNRTDHYPYLIKVDGETAGFSLIRPYPFEKSYFDIGQFFILRKYKKLGIGSTAFKLTVNSHPGKWITRVLLNNDGAYEFWLKVIKRTAKGQVRVSKETYHSKTMHFIYYEI